MKNKYATFRKAQSVARKSSKSRMRLASRSLAAPDLKYGWKSNCLLNWEIFEEVVWNQQPNKIIGPMPRVYLNNNLTLSLTWLQ